MAPASARALQLMHAVGENKKTLARTTGQTMGCPASDLIQSPDAPILHGHFNGVDDMVKK